MTTSSVAAHYMAKLGRDEGVLATKGGVRVFAWPTPDPGTVLLGTVGMAEIAQVVPAGSKCIVREPRTELVMLAERKSAGGLAEILCDIAHYPEDRATFLHWFHAVTIGRPLVPGSPMTSVLLTFPSIGAEDFATLQDAGARVDFLEVVPITADERRLFDVAGSDALEDALEERDADTTDLFRASVA